MYNNQGNNKQYTLSKQVTYLEVQKLTNWHNIYSEKKETIANRCAECLRAEM